LPHRSRNLFARAIVTGKIRNQMRLLKYSDKYEGEAAPARSARIADLVLRLERIATTARSRGGTWSPWCA